MSGFLIWSLSTLLLIAVGLTVTYRRIDLKTSTIALGVALFIYSFVSGSHVSWLLLLWLAFAGLVTVNMTAIRKEWLTAPMLKLYKSMVPTLSDTEREALEAGTVWWDGELFSGQPDWSKLTSLPAPQLSDEEQAFLNGPTDELCRMLDDWEITHKLADLSPETWAFIKKHRFFAMIITKEYGGLEFSPLAIAMVLAKISSRSVVAASTVGVPNSLGPGELLLHYGTDEQKKRYLPGLASGEEIPCFALTAPRAGSDAASIPDTGIVCMGEFNGEDVLGIRLNWDKRYITLAPVATVLGLAFKLFDPDHLIGDTEERGITAALIPTDTDGVEIGRRHFPLNIPFQNGPTQGKDVFLPIDCIIGGPEKAGQGWKMLVELLAKGRGIVLPANAMGGGKAAVCASGAYTRIRQQFNTSVSNFEGVGEALARIAAYTYTISAGVSVTATAQCRGEDPAVPSAILKYHCTEMGRAIANDAMDVHGGKGIMLGPNNYLGRGYQAIPIGITVEGANILTRSLIIFGQGAIRCHPFVLKEMEAAREPDFEKALHDFDHYLFSHIGAAMSNGARAFVTALTHARFSSIPVQGDTARYYQHINRYSAAFAIAADVAMLTLGGELKRKEMLSARLGDVFSSIYLASMVLKHYEDQGRQSADLPLVEWSCRHLMYQAQEQLHGVLRNFPNRPLAMLLRVLIFPRGRTYSAPSDKLGQQIVALITHPTKTRERLCQGIYMHPAEPGNPLGQLQEALEMAEEMVPLEKRLRDAVKAGVIKDEAPPNQIDAAEQEGVFTAEEAGQLRKFDDQVMELIAVDDFDSAELSQMAQKTPRRSKKTTAKTNKAA